MKRYKVSANRYNDLWNVIKFQQTVITVSETVITVQTGSGTGGGNGYGFFPKKNWPALLKFVPVYPPIPGHGYKYRGYRTRVHGYGLYPAGFSKPLDISSSCHLTDYTVIGMGKCKALLFFFFFFLFFYNLFLLVFFTTYTNIMWNDPQLIEPYFLNKVERFLFP
jgi:hypothetical protein